MTSWGKETSQLDLYDQKQFEAVLPEDPETPNRAAKQRTAVKDFLLRKRWVTLEEIATAVDAPVQSVSARVRDLRKPRYGGHKIEKRLREKGVWEYHLGV